MERSFLNRFHQVGSAVVGYHQGREVFHQKPGLGGSAEVYDAELAGLVTGLSESISFAYQHPEVYHIQLYADNISAISIASNLKPRQGQLMAYIFYQKALRWLDSSPHHHLSISWSPGHTKIRGNEKADKLAKEAAKLQIRANLILQPLQQDVKHVNTCLPNGNGYGEIDLKMALQTVFPHLSNPPPILKPCAAKEKSLAALFNAEQVMTTLETTTDPQFLQKAYPALVEKKYKHISTSSTHAPNMRTTAKSSAMS